MGKRYLKSFTSLCGCCQNMGPLGPTRSKGTVETLPVLGQRTPKKSSAVSSSGNITATFSSDLQAFIYIYYMLKGKMATRLCFADLLGWIYAELRKMVTLSEEKSALPPWERFGFHLRPTQCQGRWTRVRSGAPTIVSAQIGHIRIFVSKLENGSFGAETSVKLGAQQRQGGLLCRPQENVCFRLAE